MRPSCAAALLCACLLSTPLGAQEVRCDALTPVKGSSTGYQKRGNRCEGVYVSNVGSLSLAAMSFTLGALHFDLKSQAPLEVSAPGQPDAVNVRAVAMPLKTYYRMDTVLPPRAVFSWPVTDVLAPEGLSDSRIGVFGWKGSEQERVLVPLRVAPHGSAPSSSKPLLTIQTSFAAQTVKWRWAPLVKGKCDAPGTWQDAVSRPIAAGWPIAIDLSKLPSGTQCFEAAAQSANGTDWTKLSFRVDIPPR